MVQTNDMRGIQCDLCGAEYREQFTYFSGTLDKVDVDGTRSKGEVAEVDKRFLDIDICEKCWLDHIKTKMMEVINKREKEAKKRAKNKGNQWSSEANDRGSGPLRLKGN